MRFLRHHSSAASRRCSGLWSTLTSAANAQMTAYDYRVRFGYLGRMFDRILFRPLMGWATAWSFDCLRIWIEKGIEPAHSIQRSLVHLVARSALAFVWVYQGLVPKILSQHPDELEMVQQGGFSALTAPTLVQAIGWVEVTFGLVLFFAFHRVWPLITTIALMVVATVGVALNSPHFLNAAFNPVSLNVLMIALALSGLISIRDLPSSRRCLRKQPKEDK